MNEKTLLALKGSIKKWKKIINKTGVDNGQLNCPLCKLFIRDECESCPVNEKTSGYGCHASPYGKWEEHQDKNHFATYVETLTLKNECEKCEFLAKKEKAFLESLLPK